MKAVIINSCRHVSLVMYGKGGLHGLYKTDSNESKSTIRGGSGK